VRYAVGCVGVAMLLAGVVLTQYPVDEVALIGGGMAFCGLTIALSAIFRPRAQDKT
jgi:hypothetical protein